MAKRKSAKETPVAVKVISVLFYIGAVFSALGALALLIGGAAFGAALGSVLGGTVGGLAVVGAIIAIAFAVLYFFIGKHLWAGKKWARIVAIILSALGLLGALGSIFTGNFGAIVSLAINGFIFGYLLFSDEAKKYFK